MQVEIKTANRYEDLPKMVCKCDAYKFPHRPNGGACEYISCSQFKVWKAYDSCKWGRWLQLEYTVNDNDD